MTEEINLKEIERKAWTSYFEDGLWDLFFGGLFLIGGIARLWKETSTNTTHEALF